MFKLPSEWKIVPEEATDIVFFSCDYDYFDRHGYALQQSINRTVGWVHVHWPYYKRRQYGQACAR